MVIKNGKIARKADVIAAIKAHKPFAPGVVPRIVSAKDYPPSWERSTANGVKIPTSTHRAYIYDNLTGQILVGASSTYELVEKIQSGKKFPEVKKKGLDPT